jgi:hypothetical protein
MNRVLSRVVGADAPVTNQTLSGRENRPKKTDFMTWSVVQRVEDRVRGGRGGRAEGEGFDFSTSEGEVPAHTVIDAQRDRALADLYDAFAVPRANAERTRDEATEAQASAERELERLREARSQVQAELNGLEATHVV